MYTKCEQKEVEDLDNKAIAQRLVELRGDKGQAEVANAVKISASALSMYECGERVPRDEVKIRLAKYYGVSIESIFFTQNVHEM